jgi:hypothetical protein
MKTNKPRTDSQTVKGKKRKKKLWYVRKEEKTDRLRGVTSYLFLTLPSIHPAYM